jgi:diguanylate cyclase (GGDEF)-like protein
MSPLNQAFALLRRVLVALVLGTPAVLAWHHFGMTRVLALGASANKAETNDDRGLGGHSVGTWQPGGPLGTLQCQLDAGYAWPYCEVAFTLVPSPEGVDLSRYDSVRFRLHYEGVGPRSVRFYLRNFEPGLSKTGDSASLKVNEVEFEIPASGEIDVPLRLFRIASWWAVERDVPLQHTDMRIDNVPFVELSTGSKSQAGLHRIRLDAIEFHGKWLSLAQVLTLLVGAWLLFGLAWLWAELLDYRAHLRDARRHLRRVESLNRALQLEAKELAGQARTDALTGALNREGLREFLLKHWPGQGGSEPLLCLVIVDIDHFKQINDSRGHACGDQVLQQFARLVQGEIRASDRLVRWGGEEFLVVCPGAEPGQGAALAEKLRLTVAGAGWPTGEAVSASFGVAALAEGEDFAAVIGRADAALYRAKALGRNRVETAVVAS